jgi:hypothetical protein
MKTIIIALTYATLLASSAVAQEKPDRLSIRLGGFDGPSYELALSNDVLWYKSGDYVYQLESKDAEKIVPSDEEWQQFRKTLDNLGVWSWQTNYMNYDVLDGTQWGVTIAYSNRMLATEGSNGYPGSKNETPSKAFEEFLGAVERLLGGKPMR